MRIKEMITRHEKEMMFNQILPTNDIRNIERTVRRICMWILGVKGLKLEARNVNQGMKEIK